MEQLKKEIIKHKPNMKYNIQLIGDNNNTFNENKLITICVFNSVHLIENYCFHFDKIFIDEAHHIHKPDIYCDDEYYYNTMDSYTETYTETYAETINETNKINLKNKILKRMEVLNRTLLLEHSARICLNPKRIKRLLDNLEINFFDGSFDTLTS